MLGLGKRNRSNECLAFKELTALGTLVKGTDIVCVVLSAMQKESLVPWEGSDRPALVQGLGKVSQEKEGGVNDE